MKVHNLEEKNIELVNYETKKFSWRRKFHTSSSRRLLVSHLWGGGAYGSSAYWFSAYMTLYSHKSSVAISIMHGKHKYTE